MLFTKSKLNRIEVLISKSLIDLNISHDEFISISNVLRLWRNETTNPKSKDLIISSNI